VQSYCINYSLVGLSDHELYIIREGNMTSPKKAIVIFGTNSNLESRDGNKATPEICPEGVSQGNDPLLDIQVFNFEHDSLCNSFRQAPSSITLSRGCLLSWSSETGFQSYGRHMDDTTSIPTA
jgi:hypothetical protein